MISEITDTLTKAKEAGVKKSKPKPQPQRKKIPTPLYSLRGGVVSKEASPRDPNINYRLPSAIYKPEAWSTVKPPGKVLAGDTNANPGHDATTSAGPRRRTPSPPRPSRSSCATQPGYRDDDVTNQRKPNQS